MFEIYTFPLYPLHLTLLKGLLSPLKLFSLCFAKKFPVCFLKVSLKREFVSYITFSLDASYKKTHFFSLFNTTLQHLNSFKRQPQIFPWYSPTILLLYIPISLQLSFPRTLYRRKEYPDDKFPHCEEKFLHKIEMRYSTMFQENRIFLNNKGPPTTILRLRGGCDLAVLLACRAIR